MPEGTHLEFKELLDPADARDRLILVKEIVAMAHWRFFILARLADAYRAGVRRLILNLMALLDSPISGGPFFTLPDDGGPAHQIVDVASRVELSRPNHRYASTVHPRILQIIKI